MFETDLFVIVTDLQVNLENKIIDFRNNSVGKIMI